MYVYSLLHKGALSCRRDLYKGLPTTKFIYIYIFLSKLSILGDGFCCVVHLGYWVCGFLLVCAPSLEKRLFFFFLRDLCNVVEKFIAFVELG